MTAEPLEGRLLESNREPFYVRFWEYHKDAFDVVVLMGGSLGVIIVAFGIHTVLVAVAARIGGC